MATHSSILAWRIPWTEEPDRLRSMGSQRVGHNQSDLACTHVSLPIGHPFSHPCVIIPILLMRKPKRREIEKLAP